ncbi:Retrovirus-related Pol polyprotein from transposon opus [Gossypium australe]|uniref:Retrovirus-related Pol polyprotein from transposon opus n=1 Tax=Gossypium australe TaxID=47621 RepID=A0A5B6VKQ0_9ROSI|nr:Retrovirus-related Pol polyprotein from transposon opus [Gossypium australe]
MSRRLLLDPRLWLRNLPNQLVWRRMRAPALLVLEMGWERMKDSRVSPYKLNWWIESLEEKNERNNEEFLGFRKMFKALNVNLPLLEVIKKC